MKRRKPLGLPDYRRSAYGLEDLRPIWSAHVLGHGDYAGGKLVEDVLKFRVDGAYIPREQLAGFQWSPYQYGGEHPMTEHGLLVLKIPFSACDLAAFLQFGIGSFLAEALGGLHLPAPDLARITDAHGFHRRSAEVLKAAWEAHHLALAIVGDRPRDARELREFKALQKPGVEPTQATELSQHREGSRSVSSAGPGAARSDTVDAGTSRASPLRPDEVVPQSPARGKSSSAPVVSSQASWPDDVRSTPDDLELSAVEAEYRVRFPTWLREMVLSLLGEGLPAKGKLTEAQLDEVMRFFRSPGGKTANLSRMADQYGVSRQRMSALKKRALAKPE
ncbi:MAG: hypothetical protein KF683_05175 [Rubrivivax sp.]|nr:hypothetical protein [Rubrivivax sp.]